jgi:hypothetical protein
MKQIQTVSLCVKVLFQVKLLVALNAPLSVNSLIFVHVREIWDVGVHIRPRVHLYRQNPVFNCVICHSIMKLSECFLFSEVSICQHYYNAFQFMQKRTTTS